MDLELLQEVVPMLKQQLEKSMLDRNYVQLERVGGGRSVLESRGSEKTPSSRTNSHVGSPTEDSCIGR